MSERLVDILAAQEGEQREGRGRGGRGKGGFGCSVPQSLTQTMLISCTFFPTYSMRLSNSRKDFGPEKLFYVRKIRVPK